MPARPPVPGVLEFLTEYNLGLDLKAINKFHIKYSSPPPTPLQASQIAAFMSTAFTNRLASQMSTGLSTNLFAVTDLGSATGSVGTNATAVAGTRAGTFSGANVCAIVQRRISRRYRGGHSRVYTPMGVVADQNNPQTWSAAFQASLQTGWSNYELDMVGECNTVLGGVNVAVNVGYYQGFTVITNPVTGRARNKPNYRVVGGVATPNVDTVNSWVVNPRLGSQRRRALQSS